MNIPSIAAPAAVPAVAPARSLGQSAAVLQPTPARILEAALTSFAARGFEATSLDALAASLGITKQTILHHFRSKDQLLSAVIDRTAKEFAAVIDDRLASKPSGWPALEAVVRAIFGLAGRRPELLGLLREVGRLGPAQNAELAQRLSPLIDRATSFLRELDAKPTGRTVEPRMAVLAAYAAVLGVVTEAEVLRQLGQQPSARLLLRRRREVLRYMADLLGVDHP